MSVPSPTGDPEMGRQLVGLVGGRARRVAAAVVDLDGPVPVRSAFIRASATRRFEAGSVTKALTGMLLADAIERHEVALRTTVGDVLPAVARSPVATVTLRELCTHTSGLPRLPRSPVLAGRLLGFAFFGLDPYRGTGAARMVALAAKQPLPRRGRSAYSNLGAALLGQVLVAAAGATDYASLLRQRIFAPLGMSTAAVATRGDRAPHGWSGGGLPRAPWVSDGYAPAGGVIATIGDLARLASGLLDGTAPGTSSMSPLGGDHGRRIGMFWVSEPDPGGRGLMIWHNGATGGYSSFLCLFPETRRAVAVLADTARPSDQQRLALGLAHWSARTTP